MSALPTSADQALSPARKWAITFSVMLVTVMQILDSTVMNVALPHIQGALSASVEEVAWVLTSSLASNAIVIPATGWMTGTLGRKRFFLICTAMFTVGALLSGSAPSLTFLIVTRIFQGLSGGPVVPMAQALLWEIFPLRQRGMAMAMWGIGVMMGPILGPTVGGWIVDNWSWRWIFYLNLPIGLFGFFMVSATLVDSPHHVRRERADWPGLGFMVVGIGCLQLVLDRGQREDWFDSALILTLAITAACALVAFVVRELSAREPILDLTVFGDRNFAFGTGFVALIGLALYSSTLLLALYAQKLMGYDAWTSGAVLAPGGLGNMISLLIAGRLVAHIDQRYLLVTGCVFNALGLWLMSNVTLGMDYWSLAWPRFVQGFGLGFIFVPLATLALSTISRHGLPNATAAFNVVRTLGGSAGVALATTFIARRSQSHQTALVAHVNVWDAETTARLRDWTSHFAAQGTDAFTAQRRATAMLYRDTVGQAQVLAYADVFWALAVLFCVAIVLIPFMRRVHAEPVPRLPASARDPGLPAPVD